MEKYYEKIGILIDMLREIDLEKNDTETIRYVLNDIANELSNIIDGVE